MHVKWPLGIPRKVIEDSGLIVISVPGSCNQSSERSDAGERILLKVIMIVEDKDGIIVAGAVEKWESRSDFQGRFLPGFSTAFRPPMIFHFSPFSPRCFRIDSPRISIR